MELALIGEKLGHSFSAIIHNYVFKKFNISANYKLIETNDLAEFIKYAKANLLGFNITIPYKEKILPYIDYLSPEAKKLNNVNTIKIINNKLYGYNTDYIGFLEMLKHYNIDPLNKDIYILGSGGASKTIYNSLLDLANNIKMVSRTLHDDKTISYQDLEKINNIDLIINATPVGMYPNIFNMPLKEEIIKRSKDVLDLIYNPKQTEFLKVKNSFNNGLLMLIIQALEADKIWFNIDYDIKLIKEVGGLFE